MSRVLVTGGAGYVGSHACKELARAGHEPIVYDNLYRGHRELVKWGPLIESDIRDREALGHAFRAYRPDAVMHFAALASVEDSVKNPLECYDVNVSGTLVLLETMMAEQVARIIFSSSCCVYDAGSTHPFTEATPLAPSNPYGWSKFLVEQCLADVAAAHDVASVALRYFNASGADPEGDVGEWHEPETHLIPKLLAAAAGDASNFRVNGNDYPTPDGSCIRDYIHVSDLARAHVCALDFLTRNRGAHIFNLGTGRGTSVFEMLSATAALTGRAVSTVVGPRRPGDAPRLVADAGKAERELGWKAVNQDVSASLRDAWNWYRKLRERQSC